MQDILPLTKPSTSITIKNIKISKNKLKKLAKKATISKTKGKDVIQDKDKKKKVLVK